MMNSTREKTQLWLLLLIGVVATLHGQTHAQEIFAPSSPASGVFAAQTQASTGENYDGIQYDALDSLLAANRTAFTGGRMLKQWDFDSADSLYSKIRKTDDVAGIAAQTGLPQFQVQRVKDHLFNNTHLLDDGVRRFDADYMTGNAWQRMQSGTQKLEDIQLFKHKLFDAKFEGIFKQNYRTSHDAAKRAGRLSGLE